MGNPWSTATCPQVARNAAVIQEAEEGGRWERGLPSARRARLGPVQSVKARKVWKHHFTFSCLTVLFPATKRVLGFCKCRNMCEHACGDQRTTWVWSLRSWLPLFFLFVSFCLFFFETGSLCPSRLASLWVSGACLPLPRAPPGPPFYVGSRDGTWGLPPQGKHFTDTASGQ